MKDFFLKKDCSLGYMILFTLSFCNLHEDHHGLAAFFAVLAILFEVFIANKYMEEQQ